MASKAYRRRRCAAVDWDGGQCPYVAQGRVGEWCPIHESPVAYMPSPERWVSKMERYSGMWWVFLPHLLLALAVLALAGYGLYVLIVGWL